MRAYGGGPGDTPPEPGTQIGPFLVESRLGEGAMGVVYLARHVTLGSRCALKLLWSAQPSQQRRFDVEGMAQASLRHTHVVAVHDVLEHQGRPVLVMEYVDGGDLKAFLRGRDAPLSQPSLGSLTLGIVRGVRAVHAAGLVHRDIKPLNILLSVVDGELVPKITDFGLAKLVSSDRTRLTREGWTLGTPSYMAPEQFGNARHVDHRADIFALGAVMYELVTRTQAFPESLPSNELRKRICTGRYDPIGAIAPDCPDAWREAVERCLQPDPAQRIESCDALLELLEGPKARLWSDDTLAGVRRSPSPSLANRTIAPVETSSSISTEEGPPPTAPSLPPTGRRGSENPTVVLLRSDSGEAPAPAPQPLPPPSPVPWLTVVAPVAILLVVLLCAGGALVTASLAVPGTDAVEREGEAP